MHTNDGRAIVHSCEHIELILRRGLTPLTDNRDALLALGFERAYPQVKRGYEATIWERSIEHHAPGSLRRVLARQRAVLSS